MTVTINDLADGLETRLQAVSGLHLYSEIDEHPHEPSAGILFDGRTRDDAGGGQIARFSVEVGVSSDDRGWSQAVRLLRTFMDARGAASIEAALDGDQTLGGIADWTAVTGVGAERRTQVGDGWRIVNRVGVAVCYDP